MASAIMIAFLFMPIGLTILVLKRMSDAQVLPIVERRDPVQAPLKFRQRGRADF